MTSHLLWLAALGPGALLLAGAVPSPNTRFTFGYVRGAALLALVGAVGVALSVAAWGVVTTPASGVGLALYADALTATMFVLVAFVGVVVVQFSRNYLDGDPGQDRFLRRLAVTLAAVQMLVIAGNLAQFALAWIGTSWGLHGLLLFYPERRAAVLAARKKFLVSRIGDACLLLAMLLLYRQAGSLDYTVLLTQPAPAAVPALLVAAGLLKSAQFPFHGWLLEVMETPTPVSALLHAGIINAGGFLVLRFAPLIAGSPTALTGLAMIGGFTALFASLVMLTQTSVKVALAWSTIAQMGFMMLECGFGAFPAALLHIVAHSLYKAHAFLSSGSVIDIARASWHAEDSARPAGVAVSLVIVLVAGADTLALTGRFGLLDRGALALGIVLALGLVHLLASGIGGRGSLFVGAHVLLRAGVVGGVWFALQAGSRWLLDGSVPPAAPALPGLVALAVVLGFAALTVFQSLLPRHRAEPVWQALYAHAHNGFYVNTLTNRLILRFWPGDPPNPASLSLLHARSESLS